MSTNQAKVLYKYLMRKTQTLPDGSRKYYQFMIRQSYKQHVNEKDETRIKQIIERSYDDADWILKKVSIFLKIWPINLMFFLVLGQD